MFYYRPREIRHCTFITFTNGSLITEKIIEKLQKFGNVQPMFSLWGLKETNDKFRGEGCFDMIMEKMDMLKKQVYSLVLQLPLQKTTAIP